MNALYGIFAFLLVLSSQATVNGLRCYRSIVVQTLGQEVGTRDATMKCKENSVCMLVEAHMKNKNIPATLYYGFCFPESEKATTGCRHVLNNMGNTNSFDPESDVTIESCKLSFCSDNLCNDVDGPPLPAHEPTSTIIGPPIQCYAIQKTTSSLGVGNQNKVNKISCEAGANCYLTKADTNADMNLMDFDISVVTGGCKLGALCGYDECEWMLDSLKSLMPASMDITWTLKSCATACCSGDHCNSANARISEMSTTTRQPITVSTEAEGSAHEEGDSKEEKESSEKNKQGGAAGGARGGDNTGDVENSATGVFRGSLAIGMVFALFTVGFRGCLTM